MSFLVFQKGYFVLHHYSISMVKNHQHFELILLLSICQLIWNMLLSKNILIELSCTARFPIENWLLLPLSLCWCWIFFLSLGIIWCTWMLSSSGIFLFAFFCCSIWRSCFIWTSCSIWIFATSIARFWYWWKLLIVTVVFAGCCLLVFLSGILNGIYYKHITYTLEFL